MDGKKQAKSISEQRYEDANRSTLSTPLGQLSLSNSSGNYVLNK
jgi:hypothetical protein